MANCCRPSHGRVEPNSISQILSEHDCLLLPTFYEGEGMPGVIIEAYQSGIPVIASRWRDIPELIQHEKTGLLVEPRSMEDLTRAMLRLSSDKKLYQDLSHNG